MHSRTSASPRTCPAVRIPASTTPLCPQSSFLFFVCTCICVSSCRFQRQTGERLMRERATRWMSDRHTCAYKHTECEREPSGETVRTARAAANEAPHRFRGPSPCTCMFGGLRVQLGGFTGFTKRAAADVWTTARGEGGPGWDGPYSRAYRGPRDDWGVVFCGLILLRFLVAN